MFNSSPQPISLNPTAPPFTYKSNNVRSNSFSSSSSGPSSSDAESHTSSQGSLHTITTASSFHPTLPPKEFIPRSHTISLDSMHTLTAESSPVVASVSSSDDQCSESHFSIGGTSNPSDTTFSTQDALAPKNAMDSNVEDLLLSMKLHAIEFSQGYYFKRAAELGISLPISPSSIDIPPRKSHFRESYEWKSQQKSVTICARTLRAASKRTKSQSTNHSSPTKYSKPRTSPTVVTSDYTTGSVWDGYVGQTILARKSGHLREWEWDEPEPETIMEVDWSNGQESQTWVPPAPPPPKQVGRGTRSSAEEIKQSIGLVSGEMKKKEFVTGGIGGGSKSVGVDVAPRGKSWMIVTQRMMEEYTP